MADPTTPMTTEEMPEVKVYVRNKVFNDKNIKKRVQGYVDKVYCPTYENRKIRKAFRNQLYETIKAENKHIMEQLRVVERKNPARKTRHRPYQATAYVKFCREMQEQHPKPQTAGHIQKMWRERKVSLSTTTTEKTEEPKEPLPDLSDVMWDYVSSDDES